VTRWMIGLVALAALAGCGKEHPAGEAAPAGPGPAASVRPDPAFCSALDKIAAAEPQAFDPLRGGSIAPNVWAASVVPKGLGSCGIVGSGRFRAEYVCVGQSVATRGALDRLEPLFDGTMRQIDACLAPPGGRFVRSPVMRFAGGERLAVWRDGTTAPGAAFTLKIEEDVGTGAYALRLGAETFR